MTEKPQAETSMDEILASIRRIIATDSRAESHTFSPIDEHEDILDLTDALPDEDGKIHMSSEFRGNNLTSQSTSYATAPSFEESLLSQATLSETRQAFHLLYTVEQEKSKPFQESTGGQTVDALMREMLKPLLKDWLDTHLPSLVKSIVTQQVEKIADQTGRS